MTATTVKSVEVARAGIPPKIDAVQGDTGRQVCFILTDMTVPETATAAVYILKPDKTKVYNAGTVTAAGGMSAVTVPLTAQTLAVPGHALGQVQILDGSDLVTTFVFALEISPSLVDAAAQESTNELGILVEATQAAAKAASAADTAASSAAKAASDASTAAGSANQAASSAANAAQSASQAASGASTAAQAAVNATSAAAAAAQTANRAAETANAAASTALESVEAVISITNPEIDEIMTQEED